MALEAGVPTKTHIINLLYRLVDGKPISTPPVTAPQALKLVSETMANVERYDDLRKEKRHASCPCQRRHRRHAPQPQDAWHGTGRHRTYGTGISSVRRDRQSVV